MLSNYLVYQVLREAGLPDGVIQFIPADGPLFGDTILASKDFGGLHFTGSTKTFNFLLKKSYSNIEHYKSYPRIVGETGGKDFHFVHSSADVDHVVILFFKKNLQQIKITNFSFIIRFHLQLEVHLNIKVKNALPLAECMFQIIFGLKLEKNLFLK